MPKAQAELIYFGKPGSFTHLVAGRIAGNAKLISRATVGEVFDYVKKKKNARGIVPIENSSAGMISESVDNLVNGSGLTIQDEYALNVKLALLGKNGYVVKKIYSHFAPFHHCQSWLKKHYPQAEQCVVDSTSAAAKLAAMERFAAAIGQASAAAKYHLDVLHFPIGDSRENLTQFFLLGHGKTASKNVQQTSLSAVLKNQVGSLCNFLTCFAREGINLKRIMSQPIVGQPNNYIFFIGVEAPVTGEPMKKAMEASRRYCKEIKVLGSYPVHPPFES
ncbi:MAG TPA: prephenate dehydratase domain-containing protein [Candidatus Methylacidiphilales bacterium]|nr:prephenate dehydratase domain-containing protein [Candidatus Methylacidiphilales bacterium]